MRDPRPITHTTAVDNFLDADEPYSFKYKDPRDGLTEDPEKNQRPFLGSMAQSLEKDPYGNQMVSTGEDGYKRLEIKPVMSGLLAAAGRLHRRADEIEQTTAEHHGLLGSVVDKLEQHGKLLAALHKIIGSRQ